MGPPPYDINNEIETAAEHAPIPKTREEAANFVQIAQLNEAGLYAWGGEWLSSFPQHMKLSEVDLLAWLEWISQPSVSEFLDGVIDECARLAEISQTAQGHAVVTDVKAGTGKNGWSEGNLVVGPGESDDL